MQSFSLAVALLLSLSSCLFAASSVYVDEPGDFLPANPTSGMTVTWKPGTPAAVENLTFGTNAFTSVQSAINGVNASGKVFIATGTYDEGAQLSIKKSVTLKGDGPERSILTGGSNGDAVRDSGEHRVLRISTHTDGNISVFINNLAIVNGIGPEFTSGGDGIDIEGAEVTVTNCRISNHEGRAIDVATINSNPDLINITALTTIRDSVITENKVGVESQLGYVGVVRSQLTGNGTGIINYGIFVLISSEVSGSLGNGVLNGGFSADMLVAYSTIRDNAETGITNSIGQVGVYGSTISGNAGGGIFSAAERTSVLSSTIVGNTTSQLGGGGIFFFSGVGGVVANNIIAGNFAEPGEGATASSEVDLLIGAVDIDMLGVNFFSNETTASGFRPGIDLSFASTGTTMADLLNPVISDNGGPTLTHALVAGSPAINAGETDSPLILSLANIYALYELPILFYVSILSPFAADLNFSNDGVEQRGPSFPRQYDGGLDLGAVEANYPIRVSGKSCSDSEKAVSITFNQNVTISDLTQVSLVNTATGNTIASTASLSGKILTITSADAFAEGSNFSVLIAGSAVTNDFGNSFGVTNSATLMFLASADIYVDQAADFYPTNPALGEGVIWNLGADNQVTGLIFGVSAFSSIQQGIDAIGGGGTICLDGTVHIAAGTYQEAEQIEISHSVTLQGESPASTIITGGHSHRVFKVSGAGNVVSMDRLTIRDGLVDGEGLPGGGAGIQNSDASLTVTHTMISGNQVTAGGGGGISNIGGMVVVSHSTFADNTATLGGGAIVNASLESGQSPELTVTNSTFSGNAANFLPPTGSFNFNGGGAIYNVDISGGGAAVATVSNSTFCENSVLNGEGGGIANIGGTLTVTNSIALGNTSSNASGAQDIASLGLFTNESNLIGLPSGLTLLDVLSPLGDFGGLTLTRALSPGSPAIDAGDQSFIPAGVTTDQRGAPRLIGGLDIGAYELTTALIAAANSAQFSYDLTTKILITDLLESITGGMGLPLTLQSASATAAKGSSIRVTDRFIIYTPASGQTTGDSFTFTVSDGFQTVQGSVQITPKGNGTGATFNISEIVVEGDSAAIIVAGIPGIVYQLQSSSDMSAWTSMGAAVTCPSGGMMTFSDPGPLPDTRFYRAVDPTNSAP